MDSDFCPENLDLCTDHLDFCTDWSREFGHRSRRFGPKFRFFEKRCRVRSTVFSAASPSATLVEMVATEKLRSREALG